MDLERAVEDSAPRVHPDVPNNTAGRFRVETGDTDAAFAEAEHVTLVKIRLERSTAAPMECRAIAARWEAVTGELTVWDSTQSTLSVRGALATVLRLDEDKVRVIAPNVGGGFGQKIMMFYPDELLVPLASMELGRPIKYIEDRVENFIGASQERTQIHTLELAAMKDGRVIGLRDEFLHDTGAFIPYGIAVAQVSSTSIAGPYRIPNFRVTFRPVYLPMVQVTPYRGCGRPHACYAIERAMDQLAGELGLDRFEVRRKNFIGKDEFPYPREGLLFADGLRVVYDSGAYEEALDRLSEAIDVEGFPAVQAAAREEGRYLGLGFGFYVEGTGVGPYEGGHVKIHPITGKVYVNTGLTDQGQGHETVFAQIAAEQTGARVEDVIVVEGDTGAFEWGVATFASRAAVCSGNAIHLAAVKARAQIVEAAANMMECSQDDIELHDGAAWVKGTDRRATLAEIATATNPLRYAFNKPSKPAPRSSRRRAVTTGRSLRRAGRRASKPPTTTVRRIATWAFGAHAAVIEVDPELCTIAVKRYVCIHDCGRMINPTIVDGQVMGGIAQGVGGAFYERCEFDEEGTPLNANFMDFLMPYATEVPNAEIIHSETPSPLNPLGVKGVGEAGTIPVAQVYASAVEDALRPFGIAPIREAPLTPDAIHRMLKQCR